MLSKWQEELSQNIADHRSDIQAVTFHELKYSGMLNGTEYLMEVTPFSSVHPLKDVMASNRYLKNVSEVKAIQVSNIRDTNIVKIDQSVTTMVDVANLALHAPTYEALGNKLETLGEVVDPMLLPGSYPHRSMTVSWSDHALSLSTKDQRGMTGYAYPDGRKIRRRNALSLPNANQTNGVRSMDFYSAAPDLESEFWMQYASELRRAGAFSDDRVIELGCTFKVLTPGENNRFVSMAFPSIAGTRRWSCAFPVSSSQIMLLGGYLLGEGEDVFYSEFYMYGAYTDGYTNWCKYHTYKVAASATKKRSEAIEVRNLWPLSWNTQFVSHVGGEFVLGAVEKEGVFNDNLETHVVRSSCTVTRLDGQIFKADYLAYLLDGYDVFTPLAKERFDLVSKTWEAVPECVNFAIINQKCSGRSVKELTAYKEYGRKRAKACKDNDFLDKPYNQQYTWKQVENKLSSLTNRSVWVLDASAAGTFGTGSASITGTSRTTTIAVQGTRFTYSVNDAALAGDMLISQANVEKMFEAVGQSRFAGQIVELGAALGDPDFASGLNEATAAGNGESYSNISVQTGAYSYGKMLTYEEICSVASIDGQLAFLCSQVTDYTNFAAFVPKLLSETSGSSLYPQIAKKFDFSIYDEADA